MYTFAVLDEQTLIMKMSDPDIDTNLYRQITNFRQKGIKVIISIGGVKDSQRAKYGRLLTDENARENFITNAVDFIKIHHFDGLDLDFEVNLFRIDNFFSINSINSSSESIVSVVLARNV